MAEAYDALIPNSELIVIPEASHSPQMEKPVDIAAEIRRFLEGNGR